MRLFWMLFWGSAWVIFGCEGDTSPVVEEKVREQVDEFRKREIEKCRRVLMAEAEHVVDSLLLKEAMAAIEDSLRRQYPPKPVKPPLLPPFDSAAVRPIFDTAQSMRRAKE